MWFSFSGSETENNFSTLREQNPYPVACHSELCIDLTLTLTMICLSSATSSFSPSYVLSWIHCITCSLCTWYSLSSRDLYYFVGFCLGFHNILNDPHLLCFPQVVLKPGMHTVTLQKLEVNCPHSKKSVALITFYFEFSHLCCLIKNTENVTSIKDNFSP